MWLMAKKVKAKATPKKIVKAKKVDKKLTKTEKTWQPTLKMIALVRAMASIKVNPTITAWSAAAAISRETYYQWFNNDDFVRWFNETWNKEMANKKAYLDNIGLRNAKDDFKTFELMQKKYAGYVPHSTSDVTSGGKPIGTIQNDFDFLTLEEKLKIKKRKEDAERKQHTPKSKSPAKS